MLRRLLPPLLLVAALMIGTLFAQPIIALGLVAAAFAIDFSGTRLQWSVPTMLVAAMALMLIHPAAFAADADTSSGTVIDFTELVGSLIAVLSAALLAAGTMALKALMTYLHKKTGIDLDNATRSYLEPALQKAIAFGQLKATEAVAAGDLHIDVKSEAIAHAAAYLIRRVPDALDHFGLDSDAVSELVEARMGEWLGVAAEAAPATATPTAAGA